MEIIMIIWKIISNFIIIIFLIKALIFLFNSKPTIKNMENPNKQYIGDGVYIEETSIGLVIISIPRDPPNVGNKEEICLGMLAVNNVVDYLQKIQNPTRKPKV